MVDGLPFGRSWLRPPHDRPHIELPPRKRIRVTSEAEDDDEEEQILLDRVPPFYSVPKIPRVIDLGQDQYYDDDDDDDLQDYEEYHSDSSSVSNSSPHARFHIGDELEESEMDDYSDEEEDDEDLERELQLLRQEAGADVKSLETDDSSSSQYDEGDDETDDQHDAFDPNLIFNSTREAPGPFSMATQSSAAPIAKDYSNVPVEILMTVFQTAFPN